MSDSDGWFVFLFYSVWPVGVALVLFVFILAVFILRKRLVR